ncbi:hypothetical protein V0U79_09520 [Hyphobacterium sp. HN65]|uniref:CBM-cenC domain-containing protein n=1 Tax=Hyphobacterium lacteum TaxID=3116575 RepID=A0ABU7LRU9_9PROT|nr:hypothetical protein [Hyphobacterium sp. HN65]MEE2526605.1 hypothetical protein [Hyphobacterium sp. HN65]
MNSVAILMAAAIQSYGPVDINGWELRGANNSDGTYVCSASIPYRSGISLAFVRSSSTFRIALQNEAWQLQEGERYSLTIRIDNRFNQSVTAHASGDQTLAIDYDWVPNSSLENALIYGNILYVNAQQADFQFELTNSSRAIPALNSCLQAGSRNPFSSGPK